jgi:RNA polymerase sigma-70 factor (ECF subfamily)
MIRILTQNAVPADRSEEFVRLLARHRGELSGYIFSLVPHAADAEEIFQEVSVVLWQKFDTFTPDTDFLRWASRVAHFRVLQFYRTRRRSPESRGIADEELIAALDEDYQAVRDSLDLQRAALARCLDRLDQRDRELVERRYRQDLDVGEIAAALERPVKSIYRSLGRIRRLLIECTQRYIRQEENQ